MVKVYTHLPRQDLSIYKNIAYLAVWLSYRVVCTYCTFYSKHSLSPDLMHDIPSDQW